LSEWLALVQQVPDGALGLGLVLVFFGALLVRTLLPRVERVLVGGRQPGDEPAAWGGAELLVMVGATFAGIGAWFALLSRSGETSVLDGLLATDLALFGAALVGYFLARRTMRLAGRPEGTWRALGLRPTAGLGRGLFFGLCALVLATPLIFGVMNLTPILLERLGHMPAPQDVLLDVLSMRGVGLGIALVLASLVGPALEELLFRGFLQGALRVRVGPCAASVMTSLLFASIHGLDAAPPVFLLSLLLCYLRESTGRLEVPIFAHCLWNGTTLLLTLTFGFGPTV